MRSPLLDVPGAVPGASPDDTVAAHYGDPYAEQRALAAGRAVVDRSNRPVITVSGPDRLSWLNSLSSQKLDDLPPGVWTQTLFLDPQGRLEHHLHLRDDGETTWIHVEPGTSEELITWLEKMRFMLRVEITDVSADWAVVSGVPGDDRLIPRSELAAQGPLAGLWAYEALRIEAHIPRYGFDTDHKTIPHELGLIETAVHLKKGCYRGQETVARVHNLGHPPRRLVFLHLDGSVDELPPHGTPVTLGVSTPLEADPEAAVEGSATPGQIGFVGSSARHYELGPIALAVVKRTVPVDIDLVAGHVAATQEVIVPQDAGRNVQVDPELRRQAAMMARDRKRPNLM
ncbi:folate-binding protein YgfZ [Herbidospora galbida]|uniref:Folate-binding protein YgfZ n=1 Tax=Herbidospora galbida TaxID=2575442 RepID=A0A4U3MR86_9ACTN|nr:folate-binding protein YgfZ [Herbidospora galbida]TKK90877.1 folate-binding protein YgfZ [Herbidospora galbida]